jgi:hypothetical protein
MSNKIVTNYEDLIKLRESADSITTTVKQAFAWSKKSTMSKLIDFYLGEGKDQSGRTIQEVWQFKHGALEVGHDYIQFIFPTIKSSDFRGRGESPDAPTLSIEDIAIFKANPKLRENLLISFDKILDFWG